DGVAEQQADVGDRPQPPMRPVHELELLALEPVGVARVAAEYREVELRDAAALTVAILHGRGLEAHGDERLGRAATLEQVERRRMKRRRPVVDDGRGLALEHGDRNALEREGERRN